MSLWSFNPWDKQADAYVLVMKKILEDGGVYRRVYLSQLKRCLSHFSVSKSMLDLGCGEGSVTEEMRSWGYKTMGIDQSKRMIGHAKRQYPKIEFEVRSAEQVGKLVRMFGVVVSNMAVHDMVHLDKVVSGVADVLIKNGGFIFSIPHPCFYVRSSQDYFLGKRKQVVIDDYRNDDQFEKIIPGGIKVRHYHRTLTTYFEVLYRHGFILDELKEVFDDDKKSMFYSIPLNLLLSFRKTK